MSDGQGEFGGLWVNPVNVEPRHDDQVANSRTVGVPPFDLWRRLRDEGILVNVVAGKIRLVTHRDVTPADIDEAVRIWGEVVGGWWAESG